jgi:hypothetical protein
MKILLTGHTSSVGKPLCLHLDLQGHQVVGVSRQTGYDLTTADDVNKVINMSADFDHVINLANIGKAQSEILWGVHDLWKRLNKTGKIISIGTLATQVPYSLLKRIPVDMEMLGHKLALEKMHTELAFNQPFGQQPQSVLLRFANYGMKLGKRSNEPYTTAEQMNSIIDFVLATSTYISTLDFREI